MKCQAKETYFGEFLFFIFIKMLGTISGWVGFFCIPSAAVLLESYNYKPLTAATVK